MRASDREKIRQICAAQSAIDSKFIDPASVAIGYWTRYKCQYGCGAYGKSLCCPPNTPPPDETQKLLSDFNLGLLVHFSGDTKVTRAMVTLEREVFLMDYYKVISFGAGPCRLCKDCDFSGCKFPKLARPSMEASGIDVFQTARKNGFPIHVLTSKEEDQNRYGLLLIE